MFIRTRMGVSVDGFVAGARRGCSSDCEPRACHATRSCSGDARPCTLSSRSAQSTGSSCSSFPSSWAKASPSHCPARQCGGWS
jgi:hypothetical protein